MGVWHKGRALLASMSQRAKSRLRIHSMGLPLSVLSTPDREAELVAWLRANRGGRVVIEASGSYERSWAEPLRAAGLKLRIVDPKRIRHFAKAAGRLAKNDPIDAETPVRRGVHRRQHPTERSRAWRARPPGSSPGSVERNRANDNTPSHRVFVGKAEIGAAWSKRSSEIFRRRAALTLRTQAFRQPRQIVGGIHKKTLYEALVAGDRVLSWQTAVPSSKAAGDSSDIACKCITGCITC